MFLTDYIPNLNKNLEKPFSGITSDSNRIKKDNIFAIEGNRIDGNKFILAIKKGIKMVFLEKNNNFKKWSFIYSITKNVRKLLASII